MRYSESNLMNVSQEPKQLTKLRHLCQSRNIILQKMSIMQLQSAYAMNGYKASLQNSNKICYIFISLAMQNTYDVSMYFEGQKVHSQTVKNEEDIAKVLNDALMKTPASDLFLSAEEQSKLMEKLFENLNKKSESILKKSSNQIIAIQEIKSSNEYITICNQIKSLSQEVKDLSKIVIARKDKTQLKSEDLVEKLEAVERKKQEVDSAQYNYQMVKQKTENLEELFGKCIEAKRKEMRNKQQFSDEASFLQYLDVLTSLKKLENQKKYLKGFNKSVVY